ncbi:MAG: acyl-CoA thioesterase [Marinobacterium sp.]|nr:acyl-CoA thioesterase [Marinobacterium sp.]
MSRILVTYYRYMSEARIGWFDSIGALLPEDGTAPVVAESGARFLHPVTWPDTVTITSYLRHTGNSSLHLEYKIHSKKQQCLCVTGFAVIVWTKVSSGKSTLIPTSIKTQIRDNASLHNETPGSN